MNREELWDRLTLMMGGDPEYQQALQRLQVAEAAYLAVVETMKPEDREVLDRYIAACEETDDAVIWLAYQIGRTDN